MNSSFQAPLSSKARVGLCGFLFALSASAASTLPVIKVLKGADQQTTYASEFPAAFVVWVIDPVLQQPSTGLRIDFTPGPGIGLSAPYAITDERGLASVTATGLAVGTSDVSAEVSGFPGTRVSFEGLVVNKATLTVLPSDLATRLGSAVPPITSYAITGFVNGDTEATAQISGMPALTTTATGNSPRANYAIKGGIGSLSAPNYDFVAGFGTLAILNGANSGNLPDDQQPDDVVESSAPKVSPEVREALMSQPAAISATRTASLTIVGKDGEVLVRSAIAPIPVVFPVAAALPQARSAIAPVPLAVTPHSQEGSAMTPALTPMLAAAPVFATSPEARSALPAVAAIDTPKVPLEPVLAVPFPERATDSATAASGETQAAVPVRVAETAPKKPDGLVHAAISSSQSLSVAAAKSSNPSSAAHKALNPPGTN